MNIRAPESPPIFVFLAVLFFALIAIAMSAASLYSDYNISINGKEVSARVFDKRIVECRKKSGAKPTNRGSGGECYLIEYEFLDDSGITFTKRMAVSHQQYAGFSIGSEIKVMYLPEEPRNSTLAVYVHKKPTVYEAISRVAVIPVLMAFFGIGIFYVIGFVKANFDASGNWKP